MKYALSILTLLLTLSFTTPVSARTITAFSDSDAIMAVARFMYDVAEDIPVSTRLTDKKIVVKDFSRCENVSAEAALSDVTSAIKRVLRYYPDEDIPFEQALVDMEDYLDHKTFKKCSFQTKTAQSLVKSSYYLDSSDKIHLRVDNVALTAE